MSIADTLLEWMSELGCGSWDDAKEGAASLQALQERPRKAWVMALELVDSGHIELDWDAGRWSVTNPALCLLPGTGLCAAWTGARPRRWQRRLDEAMTDLVSVFDFCIAQGDGPSARFVKARSADELAVVAERLGLRFAVDPATALADRLPEITPPSRPAARPVRDEEVHWFDASALQWRPTVDIGARRGLFRLERAGRRVGRWRDDDDAWWEVDLSAGMALTTRDAAEPVIAWSPRARDGTSPTMLRLRRPLMLPQLCRRVAIASSGLLPTVVGRWICHPNVSRANAQRIAAALGHRLGSSPAQ